MSILSVKGEASKYIYNLVKHKPNISKKEVISTLFFNQLSLAIPIAPFNISDDGTVNSDVISLIIDDLVETGVLSSIDGSLKISALKTPFNQYSAGKLSNGSIGNIEASNILTNKREVKIGAKTFKVNIQCSLACRQLSAVIPQTVEMGILFSLPPDHSIFESAIPLLSIDNVVKSAVVLAPSEKIELREGTIRKNLKKIKNFAYHLLEKDFNEMKLTESLKIIALSLLPLSSISQQYECSNGHVHLQHYDNFLKSLVQPPLRCEKCLYPIVSSNYIINNPKIFADWKNGALNEFFVSSVLGRITKEHQPLWNFNIGDDQFDTLNYDDTQIITAECKRIFDVGTNFQEGILQLEAHKKKLKDCGLPIKSVFFTLIREKAPAVSGVDVILTANDFKEFVEKPIAFL